MREDTVMSNEPTNHPDDGHDHYYTCVRCGVDSGINEALAASRAETAAAVAALKQARDRMEKAFAHQRPGQTWEDREIVAQELYFGQEEAEKVVTDLTAAAQAYKAEVARAAVEPFSEIFTTLERLRDQMRPHDGRAVMQLGDAIDETIAQARALLAQSPATSDFNPFALDAMPDEE